jgi:hypothetical protein
MERVITMANEDLTHGTAGTEPPDGREPGDGQATTDEADDDLYAGEFEVLEVETMDASMTVIGSVSTSELSATQSMIGSASVSGDAEIVASAVGVLTTGSVDVHQSGACAMMVDGDASIDQSAVQVAVAHRIDIESGGAGIVVADEVSVAHGWVGVMAARNAALSDDSRVIIDGRSALIIGGLLFGGLGLVAIAVCLGARRVAARIPHAPWASGHHGHGGWRAHGTSPHLPHVQMPDLPDMPPLGELVAKLRHAG